jgi:putative addiction module component (TIGR02574 family)
MSNTYNDVINAALALPSDSRAMLVEELLLSLDAVSQTEIDTSWRSEIERRQMEIKEGKATLIPGEQVISELRAQLKR